MCFAPQRLALFRHLNFQKWSEPLVCFVHFDIEMSFAPQRRAFFRHLSCQKWSAPGVFCTFLLRNLLRATTACTFSTSQLPKVVRSWCALYILTSKWASRRNGAHTWCVLYIFTSKSASRHNGVHFFDISTSKSGPKLVWIVHLDFEMCVAPQRLLYILTCKCVSLRNVVQFVISHLASWLRTRHFSEPTFRPSGAPNHWENTVFRNFPAFSRTCIFFLLTLSLLLFFLLIFLFSLPLPCSAFHLSEVWLLNFLRLIH